MLNDDFFEKPCKDVPLARDILYMMAGNDIHIDLLDRFMSGCTSPEEERELLEWFRDVHSRDKIFSFYEQRWKEVSGKKLSAEMQGQMFYRIKNRIAETEAEKNSTKLKVLSRKISFRQWWSYVAVVFLCASLGIGSYLLHNEMKKDPREYIVSADKGQRANLTLPDGTKVWLNSHTRIIYDGDYGKNERSIFLSGEAYFEVAKDKEHRFVVKTDDLEVEALGTTFNVKAYDEDTELIATLFEGSIRATTQSECILLSGEQCVHYNRQQRKLAIGDSTNVRYARMWRDNALAFNGETLSEIAVLLNRIYDVNIQFVSEEIKDYKFYGVIKNNSLENVIELISLTVPIIYEIQQDTIVLSKET